MGTIPCLYDTNTRFLLNQIPEVGLAPRKGTTPAREKMIYWI